MKHCCLLLLLVNPLVLNAWGAPMADGFDPVAEFAPAAETGNEKCRQGGSARTGSKNAPKAGGRERRALRFLSTPVSDEGQGGHPRGNSVRKPPASIWSPLAVTGAALLVSAAGWGLWRWLKSRF